MRAERERPEQLDDRQRTCCGHAGATARITPDSNEPLAFQIARIRSILRPRFA
jgi:hypothetical protein